MSRRVTASRGAFSLLEVMIATAILAGSAMVLLSLIDFGTRLGNRSEARITALVLAQSILDESIASLSSGESEPLGGELPGPPARSYRVTVESIPIQEVSEDWNDSAPPQIAQDPQAIGSQPNRTEILCVTVELFEGSSTLSSNSDPLVKLARWVRLPATAPGSKR